MIIFVFISLVTASEWTKCSKPCNTGEQSLISDLTVKRGCNFEKCDTYDEWNLLQDGRMNDRTKWDKSPVSELTQDEKSYNQKGFTLNRHGSYKIKEVLHFTYGLGSKPCVKIKSNHYTLLLFVEQI